MLSALALAATLAGCAQTPQRTATQASGGIDPKYGVTPSPRVVADGEPVPKGGGAYIVGKPYKIAGKTYYPSERAYSATGSASWYGADFHGRKTANGEIFDRESISAAHPTMPLPSYARVTNLRNSHSIIVRVNDRGPYHGGRVMDVSQKVAEALDFKHHGTAKVRIDYVGKAHITGSDDRKLLASLRTDGEPAALEGMQTASPTLIAEQSAERPHLASLKPASLKPASATRIDGSNDDDGAEDTTGIVKTHRAAAAPVPPTRPFDLGAPHMARASSFSDAHGLLVSRQDRHQAARPMTVSKSRGNESRGVLAQR